MVNGPEIVYENVVILLQHIVEIAILLQLGDL